MALPAATVATKSDILSLNDMPGLKDVDGYIPPPFSIDIEHYVVQVVNETAALAVPPPAALAAQPPVHLRAYHR